MRKSTKLFLLLSVLLSPFLLISQDIEGKLLFQGLMNSSYNDVFSEFNMSYQLQNNQSTFGLDIRENKVLYVLDSIVSPSGIDRYFYDDFNRLFKHEVLVPWGVTLAEESIIYREGSDLIDSIKVEIFNLYDGSVTSNTLAVYGYDNFSQVDTVYFERNNFPNNFFKGLIIYDYNGVGKVNTRTGISIDEYNMENITNMNEFSYDTLGRLSEEKFYNIPTTFGEFGLTSVKTFNYDSISNVVFEMLDPTNPDSRTSFFEHTINDAGDLISTLGQTNLTTFVYDFETTIPNLIVPPRTSPLPSYLDFYERPSRLLRREIRPIDADGNIGLAQNIATYFWSQRDIIDTSVSDFSAINIEVYPNPAQDFINLQIEDLDTGYNIEVYDLLGRKQLLKDDILNHGQQINVSSLIPGTYFFTLQKEGLISYSGRFVKN